MSIVDEHWQCEDGLFYTARNSIFTSTDSIWTYNCPCPLGKDCSSTRHVCRFKSSAAGSLLNKESDVAKKLVDEFEALISLFTRKFSITDEVVTVKPLPQPEQQLYTMYSTFRDFRDQLGLRMITKQCKYKHNCQSTTCAYAHSIQELSAPFANEKIRHFYKEKAIIKDKSYMPREFIPQDANNIQCPSDTAYCKKGRALAQLFLYDIDTLELVYPYYVIRCNDCKRVSNMPLYK